MSDSYRSSGGEFSSSPRKPSYFHLLRDRTDSRPLPACPSPLRALPSSPTETTAPRGSLHAARDPSTRRLGHGQVAVPPSSSSSSLNHHPHPPSSPVKKTPQTPFSFLSSSFLRHSKAFSASPSKKRSSTSSPTVDRPLHDEELRTSSPSTRRRRRRRREQGEENGDSDCAASACPFSSRAPPSSQDSSPTLSRSEEEEEIARERKSSRGVSRARDRTKASSESKHRPYLRHHGRSPQSNPSVIRLSSSSASSDEDKTKKKKKKTNKTDCEEGSKRSRENDEGEEERSPSNGSWLRTKTTASPRFASKRPAAGSYGDIREEEEEKKARHEVSSDRRTRRERRENKESRWREGRYFFPARPFKERQSDSDKDRRKNSCRDEGRERSKVGEASSLLPLSSSSSSSSPFRLSSRPSCRSSMQRGERERTSRTGRWRADLHTQREKGSRFGVQTPRERRVGSDVVEKSVQPLSSEEEEAEGDVEECGRRKERTAWRSRSDERGSARSVSSDSDGRRCGGERGGAGQGEESRRRRERERERRRTESSQERENAGGGDGGPPREPFNPLFAAYDREEYLRWRRKREQQKRSAMTRKRRRSGRSLSSEREEDGRGGERGGGGEEGEGDERRGGQRRSPGFVWRHDRFAERSPSPDRLRPPQPWDTRKGQWRSRAGGVYLPPRPEEVAELEIEQSRYSSSSTRPGALPRQQEASGERNGDWRRGNKSYHQTPRDQQTQGLRSQNNGRSPSRDSRGSSPRPRRGSPVYI